MASIVLTAAGSALGGPLGGAIGAALGGLADRAAVAALTPARQVGGRVEGLQLQSTAVGAPMPAAFGRARVAGQVIWAARFKEKRVEVQTGGGKGGPKAYSYSYSLSFAVAIGEGPIDGIGRIWADGEVMDLSTVAYRLHTGTAEQRPDPLIEAIEGDAPAYRATAYLVFEDLPLDAYGHRPPQLNVEVFRRPRGEPALEDRLTSVNLIPAAGEFVYSIEPVLRQVTRVSWASENVNNAQARPDVMVALDQLQAQLPHVDHVNLVVAWFGDDLRCGHCTIRPGVERAEKVTRPLEWRVEVARADAHVISEHDGGPAYGGTPSDQTVLALLAELAARGIAVTLYPFVMMDVPPGNGLPDPHGGEEQAAYPWRGRITGEAAPGRTGSPDKTSAAATQVTAFFGAAAPGDFVPGPEGVSYHGAASDWGYRRLVLHYAHLAAQAGSCEGFLIGSELVGLTTLRSAASTYPAVAALKTLAGEVKAILGSGAKVGYAGDWTEWNGHAPADGSGDLHFHLDPLWSDDAIDFIGVDLYAPLADWRVDGGGVDAAIAHGPYDRAYLAGNVVSGEDFDWFYADADDRAAQVRTPITDGAYDEPWVYRAKDLHSWWANAHHDRPGGVRAATPTAWSPRSKPLRLIEFGCPAVDRGANSPNLFVDPKSSESHLPPDSTGVRDDRMQRRALEAVLDVYGPDGSGNPQSPVYGGPMIERACAWCWDARPYPDFPARGNVWKDAPNWTLGHWLTGRMGTGSGADLITALLVRAGLSPDDFTVEGVAGEVAGYVVAEPQSTADALAPLALALGFDAAERDGLVAVRGRDLPVADTELGGDDFALPDEAPAATSATRTLAETPDLVRVRFIEANDSYQAGSVVLRADAPGGGGPSTLGLPVVMEASQAEEAGRRRLARAIAERDAVSISVSPLCALAAEAGDLVTRDDAEGAWRVVRIDLDETPRLHLVRAETLGPPVAAQALPRVEPVATLAAPPVLHLLDLPPLEGAEDDARMLAAVAAEPWRPYDVHAGPSAGALTRRGAATNPATVGRLASALPPGPLNRWDRATRLLVRLDSGVLVGRTAAEVLAGLNAAAVQGVSGAWEVLQFAAASPVGDGIYALSLLLRGQLGTPAAGAPVGAPFVLLDASLSRMEQPLSERALPLVWRAAPAGGPAGGLAATEANATWNGVWWRPWSPAHLRAGRLTGGDLAVRWVRRARLHGDGWEGEEPPLGEEAERYRLELLDAASAVLAIIETSAPAWSGPAPSTVAAVRVAQHSAVWGWGTATQRPPSP